MKEPIRTYYVKFAVDTLHTEAVIKAYSESDAKKLLEKQYSDCKVTFSDIDRISEEDM